jgi:hypothetical protein
MYPNWIYLAIPLLVGQLFLLGYRTEQQAIWWRTHGEYSITAARQISEVYEHSALAMSHEIEKEVFVDQKGLISNNTAAHLADTCSVLVNSYRYPKANCLHILDTLSHLFPENRQALQLIRDRLRSSRDALLPCKNQAAKHAEYSLEKLGLNKAQSLVIGGLHDAIPSPTSIDQERALIEVISDKNKLKAGETWHGTIRLWHVKRQLTKNVSMLIDGKPIDMVDGLGVCTLKAGDKKQHKGKVVLTNPLTGEKTTYEKSFQIPVAQ